MMAGTREGAQVYEKYWDMPMSGGVPDERMPVGFARFAVGIVKPALSAVFRYRVDGRDNLASMAGRTGLVVAGNHTSFLDVIFMYMAIRPYAWPRFMARDTLFRALPPVGGWVLSRVGCFPVTRDSADRTAVKRAARFLKQGEVVCIMPEGTRRGKSDTAPQLHAGVALIARMGKSPILPMTVRDAEKVKQKGQPLRFPKVTAEFGNPVFVDDFDFLSKDQRLEGCTWYVMRECFALSQRCAPEDVDMRALFPEAPDYSRAFREHPIPRLCSQEVAALFS